MTPKDQLHQLIEELDDEDIEEARDYLQWLVADEDTLTREELQRAKAAERRIAHGEYVTLEEAKRQLGF